MLRKLALQFRAAPTKTNTAPQAKMRDRVCDATSDVLAHPTQRENAATGKLHGVDDFVVSPLPESGQHRLAVLRSARPSRFTLRPVQIGVQIQHLAAVSVPLSMSRIHRECPDSDPSDWLVVPADVLLRKQPDEEEDEEQDGGKEKEDDDCDETEWCRGWLQNGAAQPHQSEGALSPIVIDQIP